MARAAARVAALSRWAEVRDRTAATAKARQGLLDRFAREVDPRGELEPAERARRAETARRKFYARLTLARMQAQRARSGRAPIFPKFAAVSAAGSDSDAVSGSSSETASSAEGLSHAAQPTAA